MGTYLNPKEYIPENVLRDKLTSLFGFRVRSVTHNPLIEGFTINIPDENLILLERFANARRMSVQDYLKFSVNLINDIYFNEVEQDLSYSETNNTRCR